MKCACEYDRAKLRAKDPAAKDSREPALILIFLLEHVVIEI